MPKFYVQTGDLKITINHKEPRGAAVAAFRTLTDKPVQSLSSYTIVSELGFDKNHDDDWWFSTLDILEQSDLIGQYKPKDGFQ